MRISQIETFIAVARYRNFTKASQVCHLVQSTISHQIHSLEEELGLSLFERDSHTVTLTPAGEQFFRDVEEPLKRLNQAVRRAQAVSAGDTGSLTVGVSGINQTERLNIVRRFRERNPGVSLCYNRVGNRNVFHNLDESFFDIALVKIPDTVTPEYGLADVHLERLYIVASRSHPVAAFSKITIQEAFRYPLLFARIGDISEEDNRRELLKTLSLSEGNMNNIILTEDMDIMQLMLESGEGIAPVPESVIGYEQKILTAIEIVNPPPPIRVGWVYRRDNPNPVLHQFISFISEE